MFFRLRRGTLGLVTKALGSVNFDQRRKFMSNRWGRLTHDLIRQTMLILFSREQTRGTRLGF